MMQLYAPTKLERTTIKQEAAVIVARVPDGDAPEGSYREVQLLVPEGNGIKAGIDVPIQGSYEHSGIGPDRSYVLAAIPNGQTVKFRLRPDQWIIAASESGLVYASVITEFCRE